MTAPLSIGTVKLSSIPIGNNSINGAAISPAISTSKAMSNDVNSINPTMITEHF